MPTPSERRRHPRYRLDLPVTLVMAAEPGRAVTASMEDLSAGGCFFRAALPDLPFSTVALSFRRGLHAPVAGGQVVRTVAGEGFAVRFDQGGGDLQRLVSALGALTPPLRSDFVSGFLAPEVELS